MKTREEKIEAIREYFENNLDDFANVIEEADSYDGTLGDDRYYYMSDFDDLMCGKSPFEVADAVCGGDFNSSDEYFRFTIWGLESSDERDYTDYLDDDFCERVLDDDFCGRWCYPDEITEIIDEEEPEEEEEENA